MNTKVIGQFLAELRKEQGLTQEQLGEKLGVTNKTVSRWENGNYLPPVEMLQQLSGLYSITINEILSGERLTDSQYRQHAEENIKTALDNSAFTLKEKMEFYKKKWLKDNWLMCVLELAGCGVLMLLGLVPGYFLTVGVLLLKRNEMMTYVESRAFDGSGRC